MKRTFILLLFILLTGQIEAQNISGGLFSIVQFYQDDSLTNFRAPEGKWRSMHFLDIKYSSQNWEAGIQMESYLPGALLGYNPELKGHHLSSYYLRFQKNNWDVTAGYFFDQFGSGLLFRTWEDRLLGINNSVAGVRVKYHFDKGPSLTAFAGNPRVGIKLSESTLMGVNAEMSLQDLGNKFPDIHLGAGVVSRIQKPETSRVPGSVELYSGRISASMGRFDMGFEYVYKTSDALYSNGVLQDLVLFDGDAYLFNIGYSRPGLGTNLSLRRAENIQLYAQRNLEGNLYNTGIVNYVPALSKIHDYFLANIYVYTAQTGISMNEQKVGEIGFQWDTYIKLKRKTFLGGKYGTRIAFNWSRWHGLDAQFNPLLGNYTRSFARPGELYFQDINVEIKKKINKKIKGALVLIKQDYNQYRIEGHEGMVRDFIAVTDWTYRLPHYSSVRMEVEHLFTEQDLKNWAAAGIEYTHRGKLGFFATDMYNYGSTKIHYYNLGVVYNDGSNRLSMSYARQRGGLICVGGVCRYVPPNKGIQINLSLRF